MKYIRTKDGRIELVVGSVKDQTDTLFYADNKGNYIAEKDILKRADTIYQLCDEFVIIRRDDNTFALAKYYPNDKTFYVKTADEDVSLNECLMYGYEIYGAIWTDKGLIYVAKMNEKGELELL